MWESEHRNVPVTKPAFSAGKDVTAGRNVVKQKLAVVARAFRVTGRLSAFGRRALQPDAVAFRTGSPCGAQDAAFQTDLPGLGRSAGPRGLPRNASGNLGQAKNHPKLHPQSPNALCYYEAAAQS